MYVLQIRTYLYFILLLVGPSRLVVARRAKSEAFSKGR